MDNDPELKAWTSDWQTGGNEEDSAEALRLYAQGRGRFMWTWILGEFAVAGVALPLLAYMGWMATDMVERWAMALLGVVTITAVSVGWWNWRGSLLASAKTTAQFVSVSAERLRRMRQAWRIGWIVLIAEVAVFQTLFAERFSWGWVAFMALCTVAFLLKMDRWIRRDEEKFESLKRELDVSDAPATSPGPRPPMSGPGRESGLRAPARPGSRDGRR